MADLSASPRQPPAVREPLVAFLPDPRADGRRRRVELSPGRILIERSVSGVAMKVQLAPSAYRGVGVGVVVEDGTPCYEIALVHADEELGARLALAQTEAEAMATLDVWANWFGLPRLIEDASGEYVALDHVIPTPPRRRPAATLARRPRFLRRRKPGALARMATSFAGAREIICYE